MAVVRINREDVHESHDVLVLADPGHLALLDPVGMAVALSVVALRDKLRDRAQPYLEPGEVIESVLLAQTGPTSWWAYIGIVDSSVAESRVVVVTDRAIILLKAGSIVPKPKELLQRLPRNMRLCPEQGKIWDKVQIGGERHGVHRRFRGELEAADAALPGP